MERVDEQVQRTNNKRIVVGLIFIALAALLFADNFNIMPWNWEHYVFSIPMLVIVIGLISLAKNRSKINGILLISIGAFFLAARFLDYHFAYHHFFWPVILAAIGILYIVRPKNQHLFSGREKNRCC